MSECLGCLDCQVMYNDYKKCPTVSAIAKAKHSIAIENYKTFFFLYI